MNSIIKCIISLSSFILISGCATQDESNSKWLKGNLHTHSYWSDGDEFPEMIMEWYKTNDYQFVALSDHNILAKGEKWKDISNEKIYQDAFEDYLEKYNKDSSIEYKKQDDTLWVKLKTFEEYRPLFEEKNKFLIMPAEEISDQFEQKPFHLNAINVKKLIQPQGGETAQEVLQNNIDAVHNQSEETGIPMLAQINHPNFGDAFSVEAMKNLERNKFFEVFNGHPHVKNNGDDEHISTEEIWDRINIFYLKSGKSFLYGIANDDSHHYHTISKDLSNAGRGWIQVKADSLTPELLLASMEKGHFYSTTGVELVDVSFVNNKLKIEVEEEEGVSYKIQFIGCKKEDIETSVLHEVEGIRGEFIIDEDILFVRSKIISSKVPERPMGEMLFEEAWTQPVRIGK